MKKLHDKYGPVVRFGPTDLSYASAQAWQDIHGPKVQEKAQEFSVQPVNGSSETACSIRGVLALVFLTYRRRAQYPHGRAQ